MNNRGSGNINYNVVINTNSTITGADPGAAPGVGSNNIINNNGQVPAPGLVVSGPGNRQTAYVNGNVVTAVPATLTIPGSGGEPGTSAVGFAIAVTPASSLANSYSTDFRVGGGAGPVIAVQNIGVEAAAGAVNQSTLTVPPAPLSSLLAQIQGPATNAPTVVVSPFLNQGQSENGPSNVAQVPPMINNGNAEGNNNYNYNYSLSNDRTYHPDPTVNQAGPSSSNNYNQGGYAYPGDMIGGLKSSDFDRETGAFMFPPIVASEPQPSSSNSTYNNYDNNFNGGNYNFNNPEPGLYDGMNGGQEPQVEAQPQPQPQFQPEPQPAPEVPDQLEIGNENGVLTALDRMALYLTIMDELERNYGQGNPTLVNIRNELNRLSLTNLTVVLNKYNK